MLVNKDCWPLSVKFLVTLTVYTGKHALCASWLNFLIGQWSKMTYIFFSLGLEVVQCITSVFTVESILNRAFIYT